MPEFTIQPEESSPNLHWFTTDPHEPMGFEAHFYASGLRNGDNWTLKGLRGHHSQTFKARLGHQLMLHGLRDVYAPTTMAMSGLLLDRSDYTDQIYLSNNVTAWRPEKGADAVEILPHEGAIFSLGGCGGGMMTFNNKNGDPVSFAGHYGFESVFDMALVNPERELREHFGIIESQVAKAMQLGVSPKDIHLRVFGLLPWHGLRRSTQDKKYKERNTRLLSVLRDLFGDDVIHLDTNGDEHVVLATLIQKIANRAGIYHVYTHTLDENDPFPWVSRRHPTLTGDMRYLFLLIPR